MSAVDSLSIRDTYDASSTLHHAACGCGNRPGTFEICWSQLDYLLKADVDSYEMGISRHKFCARAFSVLQRSRSGVCSGYLHRLQ